MSEENISFFSFLMWVDEFGILNFFKPLNLRFNHRVAAKGIDTFGLHWLFYLCFAFLVYFNF